MVKWVTRIAFLGVIITAGCATQDKSAYVRDGVQYGVTSGTFRGRWWSYYERGSSFLSGEFLDEAVSDFETALINRRRDSWRARTYGLHFTHYFPNREIGIAYYYQGRYAEAAEQLKTALEMVDTARAQHYLGLTKRALIAQGTLKDEVPPALTAGFGNGGLLTHPAVALNLTAHDDLGVAEIQMNGRTLAQRAPTREVAYSEELMLSEGVHDIEFSVTDLADRQHTETVSVTVDLTGPTIGLFAPVEAVVIEGTHLFIEGVCVDINGVDEVRLADRVIAQGNGETRVPFTAQAPLNPGENRIRLTARDTAGNETESLLLAYQGAPSETAAHLWLLRQRAPELLLMAQNGDMELPDVPESEASIVLKSPRPDRPNRHNRTVRVSGEVLSADGVTSLTINDEPFEQLTGAPKENFDRRIPIQDGALLEAGGKMQVAVHAVDASGAHLEETVNVELRPVSLDTRESRLPIAALAFSGQSVDDSVAMWVRDQIETRFNDRKRFRVLDRLQLAEVLTEQQLSAALADPVEALRMGRLARAYMLLFGNVYDHGASGIEIKLRVIDTETGDVMDNLDGFAPDTSPEAMGAVVDALSVELEQLYPRMSGELLAVRGNDLFFDWTAEDGLKQGAYVIVVYEEPEEYDEELGISFGGDVKEVGRARLQTIRDKSSQGRLLETLEEGIQLEQGMAAITM